MRKTTVFVIIALMVCLNGCYVSVTSDNDASVSNPSISLDEESRQISKDEPEQTDSQEEKPQDEIQSDILLVEQTFKSEPVVNEEEPVVTYTGNLMEDEEDSYEFTALRDGVYGFTLSEVKASSDTGIIVYDTLDNEIIWDYSGAAAAELEKGETYKIIIRCKKGETEYQLDIGVPKEPLDVSNISEIDDQISYYGQKNDYMFTAPVSGIYRFDLTDMKANNTFALRMYDLLDNEIIWDYSGGASAQLEAGDTYNLNVIQNDGYGSYKLRIGFAKEKNDISSYHEVQDSIEFLDQRNIYSFTADSSKRYTFELSEFRAYTTFTLLVYDRLDNEIIWDRSGSGSADLKEGEVYTIIVEQYENISPYKLIISE